MKFYQVNNSPLVGIIPDQLKLEDDKLWKGFEWNWNGSRLVRGFDAVASNYSGGGPRGIGSNRDAREVINWNAMRGDLELLSLSGKSTSVKHYSGWVDEALLQPYPTVVLQERSANPQPNPLDAIAKQLLAKQRSHGRLCGLTKPRG